MKQESLKSIDQNLQNSALSIHSLIDLALRESIQNYLRGRVEDSIYSMESIHAAILRGTVSPERGKRSAEVGLLTRKIGESGYFYVIDSTGLVLIHPEEDLLGTSQAEHDFIKQQIARKDGYLQYEWQNPGEESPRKKALYMSYFEPWDWIITASVYLDEFANLINPESLRPELLNPLGVKNGYKYIVDREGKIIYHPYFQGQNIFELSDNAALLEIFRQREEDPKASGITEYLWQNPDESAPTLRRAYYTWFSELDWCVVSTYILKEQQRTAYNLLTASYWSNILILILSSIMLFLLTGQIIRPLSHLTERLIRESELLKAGPFSPDTKDEIRITEQALEIYTKRLQEEQNRVEEATIENLILAQFPNDAQFPIIRLTEFGDITFANTAARNELFPLLHIDPENPDQTLFEEIYKSFGEKNQINKNILGTTFHIFKTPIHESEEVYLHFYDLTTEQRYQTLQKIWESVFSSSIEGITITDTEGYIQRVNHSFTRVTGYSKQDALGKHTRILKSNKHDTAFYKNMWEKLKTEGTWEGEIWNRRKSGEIYPEWLSITAFTDSRTLQNRYMAIFHDISDIYQKEEELAFVSSHDILTNLPNRSLFYDRVKQALMAAGRTGQFCAVITLDIHGFTMINDHMGQIWGDRYLTIMSELLKKTIRSEDTLARLGSDDFAILLPRLDKKDQCMDVLQRIWDHLRRSVQLDNQNIVPLLNIGIGFYPDDAETADALVQRANLAMIKSKSNKPGSHQFYDPSLDEDLRERFEMEQALKQAVEKEEFRLMYQPKGDLNTGEVVGFEALIRWDHPEKGVVSPVQFIPIMEETGMLIQVGDWIIREACRFIKNVHNQTEAKINVGINISATQFGDPGFVQKLDEIMIEENVTPESIDLEITESITAMETEGTIAVLNQLHERRFSISIDDFGTGYSSLQYLNELPFDVIKIDRSFIAPLPETAKGLPIVRSIIGLGKNYRKKTVAEGIETEAQAELLREEGCDIIQGYLFSRPLDEAAAMDFLEKNASKKKF